ncbi:MAG: hypothetical protein HY655_09755 [Acidobacteria bacterium]|nr:hypothetical protein [Acidobacteriota bacterium]
MDESGRRSGVYTEYFASNTVPTSYCDGHVSEGFYTKITTLFGGGDKPAPPRVAEVAPSLDATGLTPEATGLSPEATATLPVAVGSSGQSEIPPAVDKRKPGFWSRIFRRGGGTDPDKTEDDSRSPKKKGGE